MDFNLFHFGLVLLLVSISFRIALVATPVVNFVKLFGKDSIKAQNKIRNLEIPGVKEFFAKEVFIGFIAYFALIVAFMFDLSTVSVDSLDIFSILILIIVSSLWLFIDLYRSVRLRRKFTDLVTETSRLQTIVGGGLDVLRFFVNVGTPGKAVRKYGLKYLVGLMKRKSANTTDSNAEGRPKKTVVNTVLSTVESALTIPDKISMKMSDRAKKEFDVKLVKSFKKYAQISRLELMLSLLFATLPATILLFIGSMG